MAQDFRSSQVRTSRLIASSSRADIGPSLMVYSASQATNFAGGYQTDMLTTVGKDVGIFVSGAIGSKDTPSSTISDAH